MPVLQEKGVQAETFELALYFVCTVLLHRMWMRQHGCINAGTRLIVLSVGLWACSTWGVRCLLLGTYLGIYT
ncbi:hypothetical protein M432DRAFT_614461 [Thermoascus aurantiacus ATCC 26904]